MTVVSSQTAHLDRPLLHNHNAVTHNHITVQVASGSPSFKLDNRRLQNSTPKQLNSAQVSSWLPGHCLIIIIFLPGWKLPSMHFLLLLGLCIPCFLFATGMERNELVQ